MQDIEFVGVWPTHVGRAELPWDGRAWQGETYGFLHLLVVLIDKRAMLNCRAAPSLGKAGFLHKRATPGPLEWGEGLTVGVRRRFRDGAADPPWLYLAQPAKETLQAAIFQRFWKTSLVPGLIWESFPLLVGGDFL